MSEMGRQIPSARLSVEPYSHKSTPRDRSVMRYQEFQEDEDDQVFSNEEEFAFHQKKVVMDQIEQTLTGSELKEIVNHTEDDLLKVEMQTGRVNLGTGPMGGYEYTLS
jgi:hypothetical protein